jgi:hypothetical protein
MNKEDTYKEVKLHNTTDAKVWTDEFFKTLGQLYPFIGNYFNLSKGSHYYVEFTDWVFGWFCNAIQTSIDLTNAQRDKRCVYILQSNSGAIVKVWNNGFEPSEDELDEAYAEYLERVAQPDKGSAATNCTLYRWNKYDGLKCWNGKAVAETIYNWVD